MSKTQTGLARAFFDAGDFAESVRVAEDPAEALLLKVSACSEAERYAESLGLLKEFERLYYDHAPAKWKSSFHHHRALGYSNTGKVDEAYIEYEAAIDWAREAGDSIREARAQNNRAKLYSEAGRFEEAIEEVDCAIGMVGSEQGLLGRFMDQKAQILFKYGHVVKAVDVGREAIAILEKHGNEVSLSEARCTYGKVLIAYGASFLDRLDPLDRVKERKKAATDLDITLDINLIQLALDRSDGYVYRAARLLGVKHPTMITAVRKLGLERQPKRRRAKSLINK